MRRISNFQWILILTLCGLLVIFAGVVSLYFKLKEQKFVSENLIDIAPFWLFWIIHTPLILALSRRFSFERRHLIKNLLIYFSAGVAWALLIQGLPLLLLPVLKDLTGNIDAQFDKLFLSWISWGFLSNVLLYWLILSANFIFLYYERYQNEILKASKLDAQLSNARLQTLKMQLQTHFLFNTLHSISALVLKHENRDAVKMINRLSELLRSTLDNIEAQIVTLEDEIEFARRYLEIERIRFQDRLAVEWEINSQALSAEVPNLILQPLVENAMRHAVDSSSGNSRIQIAACLENGRLSLEVRDDGKCTRKISAQHDSTGLGLKNTRARLSELYGEDYRFSLSREDDEWTTAQIVVPFHRAGKQSEGESQ